MVGALSWSSRPAPASRAPLRKSRREIGSFMPRRCSGMLITLSPTVTSQMCLTARHQRGREETAEAAAHHGGDRAEELGDRPGFQLAELRPAHEEDHVDPSHAPAQLVGRLELPNDVTNHRTDRVRATYGGEADEREPEAARDPENDGRGAVGRHGP